jgi:Fe-S cluster assembly iron-binding protein IscA
MRLTFTLISLLLFMSTLEAQKLTGIWRGYFSAAAGIFRDDIGEEMYKYEVQIDQQSNNSVKGVTYSYKSTVFYGKSSMQGIFTASSKNLILKELKLVELKIGSNSEPCLMTCYLDYVKIGKLEVLQGTFISTNAKNKKDCGSGKVYLERVLKSDFELEDFLAHPKPQVPITQQKPNVKPSTTDADQLNRNKITDTEKLSNNDKLTATDLKKSVVSSIAPKVLTQRDNFLIKRIISSEPQIKVELFDNGTIDNDTISLYHNNEQVIKKGKLNYQPLTYSFTCGNEAVSHELILVAENLGEIPPNTAIMVVTIGKKRQEIFLTSDEKKNAKIIIDYKPNK